MTAMRILIFMVKFVSTHPNSESMLEKLMKFWQNVLHRKDKIDELIQNVDQEVNDFKMLKYLLTFLFYISFWKFFKFDLRPKLIKFSILINSIPQHYLMKALFQMTYLIIAIQTFKK